MIYNLSFIGAMIKDERQKAHMTQTALSLTSGISRATINALENFKARDVSVNTITSILSALHPESTAAESTSTKPGFDFPYVWSNPNPGDDLFIEKVLERSLFKDVVVLCAHYGVLRVANILYTSTLKDDRILIASITRMLSNIQKGFSRAG
jgi:transcriptional regulator with XRE-family HTH domain